MSLLSEPKMKTINHLLRRQGGYTLIETTIVVAMMVAITSTGLGWLQYSKQVDLGESVASTYLEINKAVQNYQMVHYDELIAAPSGCSTSLVRDTNGATVGVVLPNIITGCAKTYKHAVTGADYMVPNILQPRLADLQALGYLSTTALINNLPLPAALRVVGRPAPLDPISLMPASFAVRIEQICTGARLNEADCPRKDVQGLLYNQQPYAVNNPVGAFFSGSLALQTAFSKLQGQGVLSDTTENGELLGWQGYFSVSNPLRNDANMGTPNVLGIRSGYGSAGLTHMMRTDGSVKPTADWDFNNKSLNNVANLQATGVAADRATVAGAVSSASVDIRGGSLTVQSASAGPRIELKSDGSVSATSASFSGSLQSGSAQITNSLSAAGANVTGALQAAQARVGEKLYLRPLKELGAACEPATETLARQIGANYNAGEGILQCNPTTNKWDALRGEQGASGAPPALEVVQVRTTHADTRNYNTGILCSQYEQPWLSRMAPGILNMRENPAFAAYCIDGKWHLTAIHPTAGSLNLTWNFLKKTRWLPVFKFTTINHSDSDISRISPFSCDAFLRPWISTFNGHDTYKWEGYSWLSDCSGSDPRASLWRLHARAKNTQVNQVDWNFIAKGYGLQWREFHVAGAADGSFRSTGLSCDEWLPPWVSELSLTDIDTWEAPAFDSGCIDGIWNFRYFLLPHSGRLSINLVFLKKN